jgi:uncharacterized protein YdhG (YjbR/CyaY superfamily)
MSTTASPWPQGVSQPAQRALAGAGYTDLKQLTSVSEQELAELHGMGPKALRILKEALKEKGLAFKAPLPDPAVDAYLAALPDQHRTTLQHVRQLIREEAPDAVECISYEMPTFKFNGRVLMHYAGFTNHCSIFGMTRSAFDKFKEELKEYKTSTGTIQFTAEKPLPDRMLREIVRLKMSELVRAT